METENITILHPDEEINSATACAEGEELAICNCENRETVTVCETATEAEVIEWEEAPAPVVETGADVFTRKCREVKDACQITAERLVKDWKAADGHPYIKQTYITQVDIYRSPEDDEPLDTFRTEQTKAYPARSFAVLGAAAMVVACTVDRIVKKVLK